MAISLRYVPCRDDVDDVVQESFVRIFASIDSFDYRGEGSLKGWVARIVTTRALDWVKENERMKAAIDTTAELPEAVEEDPPDFYGVPPEVLTRMIGRLPSGCRLVLNLYVFEHLSHAEIGRRLGIQRNSSASQYSRAKHLLEEMIQEYLNSQRI